MNVNTTDATTGATALLLSAQNTHTSCVNVNTTDATTGATAMKTVKKNMKKQDENSLPRIFSLSKTTRSN